MYYRKIFLAASLVAAIGACSATDENRTTTDDVVKADNTGINQRDQNEAKLTPMDQGTSEADRMLTQSIRQTVVENASLSLNAKNIKVISIDGVVTLRGPVDNATEKQTIVDAARAIAGVTRVVDELEVVTPAGG